jgi:hypothetical protein
MSTQTVFIPSGATSVTVDVALVQNAGATSPGNPITGLVYNTSSLTCYQRNGPTATSTAITLAPQTVGGAWSSGGFVAADGTNMPGSYRFDLPNSLVPTSGEMNVVFNGAANLATHTLKIIPTQQLLLGAMTESYAATTVVPSAAQALLMALQALVGFTWAGTSQTVYKRDNATTAFVNTANSASNPSQLKQTT